jgi:hypothetical protein
MPRFIQLVDHWLNAEAITRVKIEQGAGRPARCAVWFAAGSPVEFQGEDARKLIEFVRVNEAGA